MDRVKGEKGALEEDELNMLSEHQAKTGVDLLVGSSVISYERMPVFDVVLDRLMRLLSTSLRALTSDVVEATLTSTASIRFGEFVQSIQSPALISIFEVKPWGKPGLISTHSDLAYVLIELLLGGRKSILSSSNKTRSYTSIEQNIVEKLIKVFLKDFSEAFTPVEPVEFTFDRTETNPKFASIVMPNNACIVSQMKIEIGERVGSLDLLIPLSTLEPVRESLLQTFMGEKFGQDTMWENHLAQEVWQTHLKPKAILDQVKLPLSEVLQWKIGSQLSLEADEDSCVLLKCGAHTIITGKIGNVKGRIALQIEDNLLIKESK